MWEVGLCIWARRMHKGFFQALKILGNDNIYLKKIGFPLGYGTACAYFNLIVVGSYIVLSKVKGANQVRGLGLIILPLILASMSLLYCLRTFKKMEKDLSPLEVLRLQKLRSE
jgi:hypothetical protein